MRKLATMLGLVAGMGLAFPAIAQDDGDAKPAKKAKVGKKKVAKKKVVKKAPKKAAKKKAPKKAADDE